MLALITHGSVITAETRQQLMPHIAELRRIIGFEESKKLSQVMNSKYPSPSILNNCFLGSNPQSHCFIVDLLQPQQNRIFENVRANYKEIRKAFLDVASLPLVQRIVDEQTSAKIYNTINKRDIVVFKAFSKSLSLSQTPKYKFEKRDAFNVPVLLMLSTMLGIFLLIFVPELIFVGLIIFRIALSVAHSTFNGITFGARAVHSGVEMAIYGQSHNSALFYIKSNDPSALFDVFGSDLVNYNVEGVVAKLQTTNGIVQLKSRNSLENEKTVPIVLTYLYSKFTAYLKSNPSLEIDNESILASFLEKQNLHKYELQIAWLIIKTFDDIQDSGPIISNWISKDPENNDKLSFFKDLTELWSGECPICFEVKKVEESVITNCGHSFHDKCIHKSDELYHKCPICSSPDPLKIQKDGQVIVWGI